MVAMVRISRSRPLVSKSTSLSKSRVVRGEGSSDSQTILELKPPIHGRSRATGAMSLIQLVVEFRAG